MNARYPRRIVNAQGATRRKKSGGLGEVDSRFKGGNQEGILATLEALEPLEALEALGGLGILEALKGAGMLAGGGGMERGVEGRVGFARGIVGKR